MKNLEYYLSLNYHKIVAQDDDGDYIVEVQELPGCAADGKSPNEAFENLREAMTSWLTSRIEAGSEVPEPRADEEYSGRILLRMAKSLHRRLAGQCALEGVSLNQYIVTLLADASSRVEVQVTQKAEVRYYSATERQDPISYYFDRFQTLHGGTRPASVASPQDWNCQPSESVFQIMNLVLSEAESTQYNRSSPRGLLANTSFLNSKKREA